MADFQAKKSLFGKEVAITLFDADQDLAELAVARVYDEGLRLQKIFNGFDPGSEISILNKKRAIKTSSELRQVLQTAVRLSHETQGAYDVSLGKLFTQRKKGQPETPLHCSYADIKFRGDMVILDDPDVTVDLGSIAKGYIVGRMTAMLKDEGFLGGIVDGRGDIMVFGEETDVGVQHPREKDKLLGMITIQDKGVATSGDYHQYFGSYDKNHIIGSKEYISITVVSPDPMIADALATALFIFDKKKWKTLLSKYNDPAVLGVDKRMNLTYVNGFEKHFREEAP